MFADFDELCGPSCQTLCVACFTSAEAKERLGPQGFDLSPPLTPAAFGKLIADDLTRWVPIVKASGAKAD
jgi:hypothetical protein